MLDLSNVWPEWKAVEKIGEGSFGKVYRCEREEYGIKSVCAIKVISIPQNQAEIKSMSFDGVTGDEARTYFCDIVKDFANEIKLMEMLKGAPNVVSVDNYKIVERKNEIGWDIYIKMEYLNSFVDYLNSNKFDEVHVKKFALDITNALELCAKYNIIHRDIKPDNIFIDKFGSFKLGDFGVARRLEGTMSMMSKKGTYSYMAPEVYRGESYDGRADIYSLGIVMYKLLNGNRDPFLDCGAKGITYHDRVLASNRRLGGERLPKPAFASDDMAAVILKACAFDPNERYADITQFKYALESVYVEEKTVKADRFKSVPSFDPDATVLDISDSPTAFASDDPTVLAEDEPTVFDTSKDKAVDSVASAEKIKRDYNIAYNHLSEALNASAKKQKNVDSAPKVNYTDATVVAPESDGKSASGDITKEATEKKKESKKSFAPVIAIVLVLAVVAMLIYSFSKKEKSTPENSNNIAMTSASSDIKEYAEKRNEMASKVAEVVNGSTTQSPWANVSVGDYITFGTYEQDNNFSNGKEDIEWFVLDVENGKALVISKYALDCQTYNEKDAEVTWETCTLRAWLNDDFYNEAFSSADKQKIVNAYVTAEDNAKYGTEAGNSTYDDIFLLSISEADKYFKSEEARRCAPTAYANNQGVVPSSEYTTASGEATCWWWLRSPGGYGGEQAQTAVVHGDGFVSESGYAVGNYYISVRPALWINL